MIEKKSCVPHIPYIGFGTAGVRNPEELKGAICMSIQYG